MNADDAPVMLCELAEPLSAALDTLRRTAIAFRADGDHERARRAADAWKSVHHVTRDITDARAERAARSRPTEQGETRA